MMTICSISGLQEILVFQGGRVFFFMFFGCQRGSNLICGSYLSPVTPQGAAGFFGSPGHVPSEELKWYVAAIFHDIVASKDGSKDDKA